MTDMLKYRREFDLDGFRCDVAVRFRQTLGERARESEDQTRYRDAGRSAQSRFAGQAFDLIIHGRCTAR
jgi:hypothetical protein